MTGVQTCALPIYKIYKPALVLLAVLMFVGVSRSQRALNTARAEMKLTPEQEKQIDDLMLKVMTSVDQDERKKTFDEVQKVFAANLPVLYFVAPRMYMGVSERVGGLSPSVIRPQLLWNIDRMTVKGTR